MVSHWTKRFGAATLSLAKEGYFDSETPLEELLPPTDWRLAEVKAYRLRSDLYQAYADAKAKTEIKDLLYKHGIKDKVAAAILLRQCGLSAADTQQVTELGRNEFYSHVTRVVGPKRGNSPTPAKLVVEKLRERLEGGRHSEEA